MVLAGELKDSVVDAAGVEVVHFLHGPGMTIGEPAFFAVDHRRVVEVIAVAPSVVIRLGRREFEPFMARYPSIKDRVLEKLASNTRWQTTMISSLMSRSLTDRLVLRLLELVDSSPEGRVGVVEDAEDLAVDAGGDGRGQPGEREPCAVGAGGAGFDPSGERSVRAGGRGTAAPRAGQGLAARGAPRPAPRTCRRPMTVCRDGTPRQ